MSALTLVSHAIPVLKGDAVRVTEAVHMNSGRLIPRGRYTVRAVAWTPAEVAHLGAYRIEVEATPDTSRLHDRRMHRPTSDEIRAGAAVPLAAQPARFWLYPGQFTHVRPGAPAVLPDAHVQTS